LARGVKRIRVRTGNLQSFAGGMQIRLSTTMTDRQMTPRLTNYRVSDLETDAPLETLELHVLARAYYAAWLAVHGVAPQKRHPLPMFNTAFEFGAPPATPAQVDGKHVRQLAGGSAAR
jgi:hypothetical protein